MEMFDGRIMSYNGILLATTNVIIDMGFCASHACRRAC